MLLVQAVALHGGRAVREIHLVEIDSYRRAVSVLTFVRLARLTTPALPLVDHAENVTVSSTTA